MSKGPYYQPGTYRFRVTDQGFGATPKGTDYFFLRGLPCKQIDGDTEYDVREYESEIVLYLSEKAIDISVDKLRALGWEGASFRELDPTSPDAHLFVGETILVECEHETNDKGTWAKWNLPRVKSASDKPPKAKSDPKIANRLDALFGRSLKSSAKSPAARKPEPASASVGKQKDDGDIPF